MTSDTLAFGYYSTQGAIAMLYVQARIRGGHVGEAIKSLSRAKQWLARAEAVLVVEARKARR